MTVINTESMSKGNYRKNIEVGQEVDVVLKKDQRTGETTWGIVKRILTKSSFHPHGIKVESQDRQVGRVKEVHDDEEG